MKYEGERRPTERDEGEKREEKWEMRWRRGLEGRQEQEYGEVEGGRE